MARHYPANDRDFERISGVGERKLREFGAVFLKAITEHVARNPKRIFADDSFEPINPSIARARLGTTARETLRRFGAGDTVEEIARLRGLSTGTIYGHLADAIAAGESIDLRAFVNAAEQNEITAAFRSFGVSSLSAVFEALGGRYDYGRLKLVRAVFSRQPV
jgi:ATP-dependent DNA helicase RecQ